MKPTDLYRAVNNIDDDLIDNAKIIKAPKKVIPFKRIMSVAACVLILFGAYFYTSNINQPSFDLTDRIVIDENAIITKVVVNIEGIITEVSEDGLSFKLDNGKWVFITDDTIIGQTCTSVEQKERLFIEPTFRTGNAISGFTEDENAEKIEAYAIYSNWNWNNPIR